MKLMQFSLALLVAAGICTDANSQEAAKRSDESRSQLTAQTGDGVLTLRAEMPPQAAVGSEFTYTVKVTNSSDNMTLHDIVLKQRKTEGFTVESVSQQSATTDTTASDAKQAPVGQKARKEAKAKKAAEQQQAGDKQASDKKVSDKKAADPQKVKQDPKDAASPAKDGNKQIRIDTLNPGESQTFVVKATADKEGELRSCLEISSYTPAICLMTKVVKPELELTKTAPKKADRCEVIEIVYVVKNGGTGDVGAIQITDDLGDGLELINGDDSLKFDVDSLAAGDTRKFIAKAFATKPGSFTSRATAKATDSELQSRSESTTTKVNAADLSVKINGPKQVYGDKAAKFTAMVMNTGNANASDINVKVTWPEQAGFADLSKVSMMKTTEQPDAKNAAAKQPTVAQKGKKVAATQEDQKSGGTDKTESADAQAAAPGAKMAEKNFKIESLAAGQTAQFEYTLRPGELTSVPTKVVATYVCNVDEAKDQKKARSEVMSSAMATLKVVRLPALQIMIIDDEDPVSTGNDVTYTTRVWNEGDADDGNVQIKMMIPEGLEFVSAQGPTKFKQDGSMVTFEPITVMKAGQREDYKLVAKASGTGSVIMKAELSSKTLDSPVTSEEPTELFDENATE